MLGPLDNTIREVMYFTWPMIAISVLTVSSIRISYLIKNKKKFVLYRELLGLFFMIYILCLFQVVTFQDAPSSSGTSNFVPFTEILRYRFGSRLFFKQVIGNMLLFIPYGFFASYYLKVKKAYLPFFLVLFASLSIETTQLMIGRVFDFDDILLNVFGGIIGYFIYRMFDQLYDSLPSFLKSNWFLNFISILLVGVFLCYIYMVVL